MASATDIRLKVIPSKIANDFVDKHHYSGKHVNNSTLHFGAFLDGHLHGVMSFGSPMDRRKVLGLVVDQGGNPAPWNDMLELNRMAFDEALPRNSESHCISVAIRLIRKNAPQIKWILSFADGSHCGDGTIYRASGFKLTGYSRGSMLVLPEKYRKYNGGGKYAHRMSFQSKLNRLYKVLNAEFNLGGKNVTVEHMAELLHTQVVSGYQFRYIYIINRNYHLAVPELPFSTIDEIGGGMYKGERIAQAECHIDK